MIPTPLGTIAPIHQFAAVQRYQAESRVHQVTCCREVMQVLELEIITGALLKCGECGRVQMPKWGIVE